MNPKVLPADERDRLVDDIRETQKVVTDLSDKLRRAREGLMPYGHVCLDKAGYIVLARTHVDSVYQLLEYAIQNLRFATGAQ